MLCWFPEITKNQFILIGIHHYFFMVIYPQYKSIKICLPNEDIKELLHPVIKYGIIS
jgi:hypothetical protein